MSQTHPHAKHMFVWHIYVRTVLSVLITSIFKKKYFRVIRFFIIVINEISYILIGISQVLRTLRKSIIN